jgi:hypothetical protein
MFLVIDEKWRAELLGEHRDRDTAYEKLPVEDVRGIG